MGKHLSRFAKNRKVLAFIGLLSAFIFFLWAYKEKNKEEMVGFEFLEDCDPSYLLPNGNVVQRQRPHNAGVSLDPSSTGSGILLAPDGLIATSAHVVNGASRVMVKLNGSKKKPEIAHVLLIDVENDLALLQIGPAYYRAAPLASLENIETVKLSQEVFTIGYPNIMVQGIKPKFTKGEISGLCGMFDDPRYWQISVPVQNGNSGGALFDKNGNVLGLIDSILRPKKGVKDAPQVQNVNYAIKNEFIYKMLLKIPKWLSVMPEQNTLNPFKSFQKIVEESEDSVVLVLGY